MGKRAISLRLDEDLIAAADDLAEATGSDRTELIACGLRRELLYDGQREFIYVLLDAERLVRYVGRARDPFRRLREHVAAAKAGGSSAKETWLADLLKTGGLPRLAIVDDAAPGSEIRDLERFWIEYFQTNGNGKLTNGPRRLDGKTKASVGPGPVGIKQVALRLDDDLFAKIESARGLVPRETWIRGVLERAVWGAEHDPSEAIQSALQDLERGQMRYAIATLEAVLGERSVVREMDDILGGMVDEVVSRPATDRTASFRRATQSRVGKR